MTKLTNDQIHLINTIHRKFTHLQIKSCMDAWLPLVSGSVWIGNSRGKGYVYDLEKDFHGWSRNDVYDAVVNYTDNKTYVTVSIPSGDGYYITVCRSGSGNLVLSDKRYQSYDVIRRHNSQVPGGLTFEELSVSTLRWVLPFSEVVND